MSRHINKIVVHCSATRSNQRFTVDMLRACHNARFHGKGIGYEDGLNEKGNSADTRTPAPQTGTISQLYNCIR